MTDWKAEAYAYDPIQVGNYESMGDITEQDMLGIHYFKGKRREVVEFNKSWICSSDGRHRSGKSLFNVALACMLDKNFKRYMEQRIVYTPLQFQNVLSKIADMHEAGYDMRGSTVVIDEAGTSMASDDWYMEFMKTITRTIQVFGYLNPIILFVAPVQDFLNSKIRKMIHTYFKVKRYNNEYTTITPYDIEYNTVRQKWYFKKPKIKVMDREVVLRRITFSKPPQDIINRYVKISQPIKNKMITGGALRLEELENPEVEKDKPLDVEGLLEKIVKDYRIFESRKSKPNDIRLDSDVISFHFKDAPYNLKFREAKALKSEAERRLNKANNKANNGTPPSTPVSTA